MYFDWLIYRELNPDLKKNGILKEFQVINHFNNYGIKEGRKYNIYQVYPDFNYIVYKQNYNDLRSLTRSQLERHWIEYGRLEKRTYKSKIVSSKTIKPRVVPNKPIYKSQKITFIIPTVGRSTLNRAITSIKNQTMNNWNCIIIFDGVNIPANVSNPLKDDKRFTLLRINKVGVSNHAARVRNEGLKLVKNGWVGFVDDDDTLSPYYVEHFNNYLSGYPFLKCIIFRMMYSDNNVIPRQDSLYFYQGNVGISFCFSSELLSRGFYFTPSDCEDYVLLSKIRASGYRMIISNRIGYLVRPVLNTTTDYVNSLKNIENAMADIKIN
jgi:hypothetical protein